MPMTGSPTSLEERLNGNERRHTNQSVRMAALGQTETRAHQCGMPVLPPGANMTMTGRFAPILFQKSKVASARIFGET
jgi:hypothetical protein